MQQGEPEHAWRYEAKCRDVETVYVDEDGSKWDIFYPPRDRSLYKGIADKAKAICWGVSEDDPECPVRKQCLLYAHAMDDTHGIWGGLSHRERSHLARAHERSPRNKSFTDWIMENDGGSKARQFYAQ